MSAARVLRLETPEHVGLRFELADHGARVAAFGIDLFLQLVLVIGIALMINLVALSSGALGSLLVIAFFLIRNFYFTASEVYWQGRTVGKRRLGLRVVARDGGPLTVDQVFARNLTREFETFLPLTALLAPSALLSGAPAWVQVAAMVWLVALGALPLLNRLHARLGDLIAGTVVVAEPRAALEADLVEIDPARQREEVAAYTFTPAQLDVYGIRELQVLEDALRRPPSAARDRLLETIAAKIRRKIAWQEGGATDFDTAAFLQAFYTAQRARLETELLFGRRRERKR